MPQLQPKQHHRPIDPTLCEQMAELLERFVRAEEARLKLDSMQSLGLFDEARRLIERAGGAP